MRVAAIGVAIALIAVADGNCASGNRVLECGQNLIVRIPQVALNSGERIVGIELAVA